MISGVNPRIRVAIIAAVDFELLQIARHLGIKYLNYQEPVKRDNVVLCLSGIGMVNAAIAATIIAERFSPGLLISTGIGGASRDSGLSGGDIAIADKEIYADTGVRFIHRGKQGFQGLKEMGFPLIKKQGMELFNEIPIENAFIDTVMELSKEAGLKVKRGSFITLSATSGTEQIAREIAKKYNFICENMEGAAVAHVATLYDIDFMEIRGISNIAGDRDRRRWKTELATLNCQNLIMEFLRTLP